MRDDKNRKRKQNEIMKCKYEIKNIKAFKS